MDVIELIKRDLQNKKDMNGRPMIDNIVVLKKDDKGYYIECAFLEGAPHDNHCLSWNDSYQEEAYRMHGWLKGLSRDEAKKRLERIRQNRESRVGKAFLLASYTCGYEEDEKSVLEVAQNSWNEFYKDENGNPLPFIPEDHICKVGCPAKGCDYVKHSVLPWTYKSPCKCACWTLLNEKTMEDFIKDYEICMPATELAKLM